MDNYHYYFTEVEEHFQRRRGGPLIGSPLDWDQILIWLKAGIPLEAVLRGIDSAFDKYEQRKSKRHEKINSILWCAQAVLTAAEDMKEAAVGATAQPASTKSSAGQGFEPETIVAFLRRNADVLQAAKLPQSAGVSVHAVAEESAATLRKLAKEIEAGKAPQRLEDLERRLTVLEEKLFAALLAATRDEEIVEVRAQADRELAPYRRKMGTAQIEQLQKQYVHKRLLEKYGLPRLSLFYM
ncbi:MAG: hypothetical protein ABSA78_18830 [Candidatus Sulfotelmatobacter sp.]